MRTKSQFSLEDIKEGISFAHERNVRVYLTLNIFTHNKDIPKLDATMGKTALSCNDAPGFVSNRILCPMLNEAILTLQEGVAEPEAIDGIMKLGMNHPIGPLALSDLIGLDTVLHIMNVLHEGMGDDKYAPAQLLIDMVEEGKLGRKSGQGFYTY